MRRMLYGVLIVLAILQTPLQNAGTQEYEDGNGIYVMPLAYSSHPDGRWIWKLSLNGDDSPVAFDISSAHAALPKPVLSGRELKLATQSMGADYARLRVGREFIAVETTSDGRFLLAALVDRCNPFNRNYCYGHYEILLFDPSGNQPTQSLISLDLHDTIGWSQRNQYNSWSLRTYLAGILPNPTHQAVIVTFRVNTLHEDIEGVDKSFLIDYSRSIPAITEFWTAGGLSWSPDGNSLAYPSLGECDEAYRHCDIFINTITLQEPENSYRIAAEESYFRSIDNFRVFWAGNQLLYPITIELPGDSGHLHKEILLDPVSGIRREFSDTIRFSDFFLWDESHNTAVGYRGGGLQLISLDTGEILKEIRDVKLAIDYPFAPSMDNYILVVPIVIPVDGEGISVFPDAASIFAVDSQLNIIELNIPAQISNEDIWFATS